MKILFINGSPNKNGNTKALADVLLNGREYETLNLTDYKIYSYGQNFEEDQLGTVIAKRGRCDRDRFTVILAQYLWSCPQCAGSFLWSGK